MEHAHVNTLRGTGPPDFLRRAVDPRGSALWQPLSGGRSNRIWTVIQDGGPRLVAKLYSGARKTPLFPNDPGAEVLALKALAGTGLAPELVAVIEDMGASAIVYRFVEGPTGPMSPLQAGQALQRLHALKPPPGLRNVTSSAPAIEASGRALAASVGATAALPPAPRTAAVDPPGRVFLHGDPVPANMVRAAAGLCFIDWQCPATGDPCEDLFVFLSPAMQVLYGGSALSGPDTAEFLNGYADDAVARRLAVLLPILHWRMAAYCLWMANRGAEEYGSAARLEIAALENL